MNANRKGMTNMLANLFFRFFAANFNLRPALNRYLSCDDGPINFTFGIRTESGSVEQAVQFENGRVRVLKKMPEKPDAQLVFVDEAAVKEAATQPPNKLMLALMENRMVTRGNLGYLQLMNFYLSLLLKKVQVGKLQKEAKREKRDYDPAEASQKSINKKKQRPAVGHGHGPRGPVSCRPLPGGLQPGRLSPAQNLSGYSFKDPTRPLPRAARNPDPVVQGKWF